MDVGGRIGTLGGGADRPAAVCADRDRSLKLEVGASTVMVIRSRAMVQGSYSLSGESDRGDGGTGRCIRRVRLGAVPGPPGAAVQPAPAAGSADKKRNAGRPDGAAPETGGEPLVQHLRRAQQRDAALSMPEDARSAVRSLPHGRAWLARPGRQWRTRQKYP